MRSSRPPATALRRAVWLGATGILAAVSCGRDATAPGAGLVPFSRVRVVLHHSDGTIALDTVVAFAGGSDSLTLSLSVPLLASAPATGEPMTLNLGYVNAAGDTVFRGGPLTITAVPPVPGQAAPPPVQVHVTYTGPGATRAARR